MRIRFIDHRDTGEIQTLASSFGVAEMTNVPHPYPDGGGLYFVNRALGLYGTQEALPFAMDLDGKLVGVVTINEMKNQPSIDYWVGQPYWGKGYATSAVHQAIQYGVLRLSIDRFVSKALRMNLRSHKVLTKNGFLCIGEEMYSGPKESHEGKMMKVFEWRNDMAANKSPNGSR